MRLLVNALSVTNRSGRHVLLGHLAQLVRARPEHRVTVLHHRRNADMRAVLGNAVDWCEAPPLTAGWSARRVWECARLPALARRLGAGAVFSPAGTTVPTLRIPQAAFCQNPWCLVSGLERTGSERLKAALQRRTYRRAVQDAAVMIFNSRYMRDAYIRNAGRPPARDLVVYQAIADRAHEVAAHAPEPRTPDRILSVSAMAGHKGADVLVEAAAVLRDRHGWSGEVVLAGDWPDRAYRRRVQERVACLGLEGRVRFAGAVSDDELFRLYASARVFCLLSRCESFGIPAVEAQAFGTPVVSSHVCAIPEVCGDGGLFVDPLSPADAAQALARLLRDDGLWARTSDAARRNAARYRWSTCSRPLFALYDLLARGRDAGAGAPPEADRLPGP